MLKRKFKRDPSAHRPANHVCLLHLDGVEKSIDQSVCCWIVYAISG